MGNVTAPVLLPDTVVVLSITLISQQQSCGFLFLVQATLKCFSLFREAGVGKRWIVRMKPAQGSPK